MFCVSGDFEPKHSSNRPSSLKSLSTMDTAKEYKPSYQDIDGALSRYYASFGRSYKNQFAEFVENNRCHTSFHGLISTIDGSQLLVAFDNDVPFHREPVDQ